MPWYERIGLALGDQVRGDDVDRQAVLGVHHDQPAVLPGLLHRPEDRAVVAEEHARVGGEELEVRHALGDEGVHLLERVVVDVAHDHVEPVVGDRVALGLRVPGVEALAQARPAALDGEVDDRRRPAERRGAGARLERVLRERAAERQLHVGVDVDAAGDDVLARRVDRLVGVRRVTQRRADLDDRLAIDQDVRGVRAVGRDDRPVRDQGAHRSSFDEEEIVAPRPVLGAPRRTDPRRVARRADRGQPSARVRGTPTMAANPSWIAHASRRRRGRRARPGTRSSKRTVHSGDGVARQVPRGPTTGRDDEGSGSAWQASTTADRVRCERNPVSTEIGATQVGPSCRGPETNVPAMRRRGLPGGPGSPSEPRGRATWRSWSCSASASWASWPSCPCRSSVGPWWPVADPMLPVRAGRCHPIGRRARRRQPAATPAMAGMTSRPMRSSCSRSSPFIR